MIRGLKGLSLLIPTFRDEKTIARVIEEAVSVARSVTGVFEIIVVNDGSADRTGLILARLKKKLPDLTIITHFTNLGYGATIKELYGKARFAWLFTIPGDYQVGAKELFKLLPLTRNADMIIGWRTHRYDSESRLWQSKIYNRLLQWFFRLDLHDVNSVRLMRTAILKDILLQTESAFVDAELAIKARRAGYRIVEVPIAHKKREGSTGGGGTLRTILPVIRDAISYLIRQHR